MKKTIDNYANFVAHNTWTICIVALLLFSIAIYFSGQVEVKNIDVNTILPQDLDVIKSMNILEDSFGGTNSGKIIIEIDPSYSQSSEPRDVRTYEILKYQENLQKAINTLEDVSSTTSSSDIIKLLNSNIPKTNIEIKNLMNNNPSFNTYISDDKSISLIQINLNDDFENSIDKELQQIIDAIPKPSGINVNAAGAALEHGAVMKISEEDMGKTSMISMISIFVILLIVSASIIYGLIPLSTIIVGVVWTMGFIGLIGMNLNTATSAVISMIMGIGIDFGIQITTRFREEKNKHETTNKAMQVTMESVLFPMVITTLAAVIGFWSMGLGSIKVLGEMGTIMMIGVIMCFLAAITVVPSIIIIVEHIRSKKQRG